MPWNSLVYDIRYDIRHSEWYLLWYSLMVKAYHIKIISEKTMFEIKTV